MTDTRRSIIGLIAVVVLAGALTCWFVLTGRDWANPAMMLAAWSIILGLRVAEGIRWKRLRIRIWYRWSRVRSWWWRLFHRPRPLPTLDPECPHEVEPTEDPDWGRCKLCGDSTFPMTERAAYGEPDGKTCMDTGLVPAEPPASWPNAAFVDARCPDCSVSEPERHRGEEARAPAWAEAALGLLAFVALVLVVVMLWSAR